MIVLQIVAHLSEFTPNAKWTMHFYTSLNFTVQSKANRCAARLCCHVVSKCDVCNRRKDKPQKIILRWVGSSKNSITFASSRNCVESTELTSEPNSNEVLLDAASCFGSRYKLPTNIKFKVDGSRQSLHVSCSQPLNLGDVVYKDENKGVLILAGFQAMSGRSHHACKSASKNQCSCNNAKQCFTDVLDRIRQKDYRLVCKSAQPEFFTRVHISSDACTPPACPHADGFKIDVCPCQQKEQCFDGKSCDNSRERPCKSRDCPSWSRTFIEPSLMCSAGITLAKFASVKGVPLRVNADGSIQYVWSTSHGSLLTDHFEYSGISCDGEKVKGKVVIELGILAAKATPGG